MGQFSEVSHFVQSALDGYNVVLFAYGQTGAGKTHTMIGGKNELRGIIPRSIEQILHVVERQSSNGWRFELEVSFLEIYNETIRDLLVDGGQSDEPREIKHGEHGAMIVTNLTSKNIASLEDVAHLMKIADKNRSYAKTDMNAHSSRSHSVFQLRIKGTLPPKVHGGKVQIIRGGLNLVDLAGSERLAKSNATGDRLRETQNINKSLSSLCSVFTAISAKQSHVPYRDSKLTYLLQPCLSGDGKALFIVNFSPAASSLHGSNLSLSSLPTLTLFFPSFRVNLHSSLFLSHLVLRAWQGKTPHRCPERRRVGFCGIGLGFQAGPHRHRGRIGCNNRCNNHIVCLHQQQTPSNCRSSCWTRGRQKIPILNRLTQIKRA